MSDYFLRDRGSERMLWKKERLLLKCCYKLINQDMMIRKRVSDGGKIQLSVMVGIQQHHFSQSKGKAQLNNVLLHRKTCHIFKSW